jgi:hypothetical protein
MADCLDDRRHASAHATGSAQTVNLLMDGWCCWCFRHLSAIRGLHYDCVIGQQATRDPNIWVHARPWMISAFHVDAAVAANSHKF